MARELVVPWSTARINFGLLTGLSVHFITDNGQGVDGGGIAAQDERAKTDRARAGVLNGSQFGVGKITFGAQPKG